MSSKPANKAPGSPAASKKKRTGSKKATSSATRKKVTKSTARKKAARTSSPKKKVASRKAQGKKTASRKAPGKKTPRKGALLKDTATDTETAADTEAKSISWMSAQATSALKAVKANQAEKGQAVLAKNKKHKERQPIDDASLIEIAEGMPVDDAALIEFAAEDLRQEPLPKPAETAQATRADSSDAAAVISEQAATPNQVERPRDTPRRGPSRGNHYRDTCDQHATTTGQATDHALVGPAGDYDCCRDAGLCLLERRRGRHLDGRHHRKVSLAR
jgi:hypothetical protein